MHNGDHDQIKKKKPRVRNRPKNKGNKEFNTLPEEKKFADEITSTSIIDQAEEKNSNNEENEAVKLIQKLLRQRLLNKIDKDQPQKTVSTSDVANAASKTLNQNNLIDKIQKEVGQIILTNGNADKPTATLFNNLGKLLNQTPVSDIETSDDETEYVEYIYKPRQYFMVTLCNLCRRQLSQTQMLPCTRCGLTYYCTREHMKNDHEHRQLCYGIQQVVEGMGNDIFYKCGDFSNEQFRSYRIVTIRKIESLINRGLSATEQEVILFPRICNYIKCREHRFERLTDCPHCGQVAFCKANPTHLCETHRLWCDAYQLFKSLIVFQALYGHLEPTLPCKLLKELPVNCYNTKQIINTLGLTKIAGCEYAALTQISTGPLTAWYALKLCDRLRKYENLTLHLIGAEIEFEVDVLHKWELFLLHITPELKQLNVVFVGPELNPRNISFEQLKKTTKCCRHCRKIGKHVEYYFVNQVYHDYCKIENFLKPDMVCFFNAGLYRSTGYALEDTWPETIQTVSNLNCPVIVTSYTKFEAPLDLSRFLQESNRHLNIVLPPTVNPFASDKPERNFISDEEAPLMFKNYYCFILE